MFFTKPEIKIISKGESAQLDTFSINEGFFTLPIIINMPDLKLPSSNEFYARVIIDVRTIQKDVEARRKRL